MLKIFSVDYLDLSMYKGFLGGSEANNPPAIQETASIPGLGRSPVFLPGKFHGQRSLAVYSPWGCKELDMTEVT